VIEIDSAYSLLELIKNVAIFSLVTYGVAAAALLFGIFAHLRIRRLRREIKRGS
jgi:hypothetical protein